MKNDNNYTLTINVLEQVLKSFAIEAKDCKREEELCQKAKNFIEKTGYYKEVEIDPSIIAVINATEYIWSPDLYVIDKDDKKLFVEFKFTNKLLDYSRIKSNLSAILGLEDVKRENFIGGILVSLIPGTNILNTYPIYRLDASSGVKIFIKEIQEGVTMAIFRADVNTQAPSDLLDKAIGQYVGVNSFSQYRDIHIDNPWTRVIICGEDNLIFKPFDNQKI